MRVYDLTGIDLGLGLLPRPSDARFFVRKEYVGLLSLLETESVIVRGCVIFGNCGMGRAGSSLSIQRLINP